MIIDFDNRPPTWSPLSPKKRPNYHFTGVAHALSALHNEQSDEPPLPVTRTQLSIRILEKSSIAKAREHELNRQKEQWNPHKDDKIRGDPSSTLFLARLPYGVTEDHISAEFGIYGTIESIRIVEPRRGYAFVVFASPEGHEKAVSAVQRTAGGMLFHGRRIIVDLERGRLQMNWKPRRLGGGLGGRFSVARQRAEIARSHQIVRRKVSPPTAELQGSRSTYSGSQRRAGPYERHTSPPFRSQSHRYPKPRNDTRSDTRTSHTDNRQGARVNDRSQKSEAGRESSRRDDKFGKPSGRVLRQY